jgi:hypothetical protein
MASLSAPMERLWPLPMMPTLPPGKKSLTLAQRSAA